MNKKHFYLEIFVSGRVTSKSFTEIILSKILLESAINKMAVEVW